MASFHLFILLLVVLISTLTSAAVFKYKENVEIDCSSLSGDVVLFQVKEGAESKNYTNEDKSNKKFIIENLKTDELKAEYECRSGDQKLKIEKNVAPYLYKPDKLSITVTEKGKIEIECKSLIGSNLKWSWKRNNNESITDSTDQRFKITQEEGSTKLAIEGVLDSDKGDYQCVVSNDFGEHSETFKLRVKDQLAALWPFLGILAEVVILCVIILVYEKKCNKKPSQTEEEQEAAHSLMGKEGSSDVKKRAVKA